MVCNYDAQEDVLNGNNQYLTVLSEEKQCNCFRERICLGTSRSSWSSQSTFFIEPYHCKYQLISFDFKCLDKLFYEPMMTFCKCLKFATLFQYVCLYMFIFNFSFYASATQLQCQNYIESILPVTHRTTNQTENCLFALPFDPSASLCKKYLNCADNNLFYLRGCLTEQARSRLVRRIKSKSNESATTWDFANQTDSNVCLMHCNNAYARLFCDHLPLEAVIGVSCTSLFGAPCNETNCRRKLQQVFQNDCHAEQNFTVFKKVMKHYVTNLGYSIQGNMSTCLSSYKQWTCAMHHSLHSYDPSNCSWRRLKPCSSLCSSTEAQCPFFRIGNKSKKLGAQPVFLCQGFGDSNITSDSSSCYHDASNVIACAKDPLLLVKNQTLELTTASVPSSCLCASSSTFLSFSLFIVFYFL